MANKLEEVRGTSEGRRKNRFMMAERIETKAGSCFYPLHYHRIRRCGSAAFAALVSPLELLTFISFAIFVHFVVNHSFSDRLGCFL